ncbi:MAG TPA: hypothetical protein VKH34_07850 [Vicinamibacterales bacterium]|nr:hypothetical protein [Vicinamibacterales bacterium]
MQVKIVKGLVAVAAVAVVASWTAARTGVTAAAPETGPALESVGPLTFGPDGMLFAADPKGATIFALDLGAQANGGKAGAADVAAIDGKIAALLGTETSAIAVTDLVIHPKTHNAYIAVMRGTGADAKPALLRVDGDGKIQPIALDKVAYTKVSLTNAPAPAEGRRNPRVDSVTDMAFVSGKLIVAGLSNEEFSSKLRSFAYPFVAADPGTSVEIFHGNHGQLETRAPVYTFIPYTIDNKPYVIASYTCTPLVRFSMDTLKGSKVVGTTIAELGAGNRPLDMILYKKDGKEFLLMSNNSRGVMKIPTADFGTAPAITAKVTTETGGIAYEKITSMAGVEQMDLLDAQRSIVLARTASGLNLSAVALP